MIKKAGKVLALLGMLIILVVGAAILYFSLEEKNEKANREKEEAGLRKFISIAQNKDSLKNNRWKVVYYKDPASNKLIARSAYVESNDGICKLRVEKRLDGTKLSGIVCPGAKLFSHGDVELKFDGDATSKRMEIRKFSNSDEVYIPSSQSPYSGYLSYIKFIKSLTTNKAVAIESSVLDGIWIVFQLKGSTKVIRDLGKEKKIELRGRAKLKKSKIVSPERIESEYKSPTKSEIEADYGKAGYKYVPNYDR